jgi:hypothetical protein
MESITVVAILKHEEAFVEEWIAYHRLIGVDYFLLYDNDPRQPLKKLLEPYNSYVSVSPWLVDRVPGNADIQIRAYLNAIGQVQTKWVAFIDGDEFIRLEKHNRLSDFLVTVSSCGAVVLPWYVYGHCGFYSPPPGLITSSLIRRKASLKAGRFKSITQVSAVSGIASTHSCDLRPGYQMLDSIGNQFRVTDTPSHGGNAYINHYICRSFETWMNRVERGATNCTRDFYLAEEKWRVDTQECLRQFVSVSKDWNEYVDPFMARFSDDILNYITTVKQRTVSPNAPCR